MSFYNKLINSKYTISLSSVSHSNKVIETEEEVIGHKLLPYGPPVVRCTGDHLELELQLAWGHKAAGWQGRTFGLWVWLYLQVV